MTTETETTFLHARLARLFHERLMTASTAYVQATQSAGRAMMEGLAARGFREVTLLGQNIDAYGRDLPGITPEGRRAHILLAFPAMEPVPQTSTRYLSSHASAST